MNTPTTTLTKTAADYVDPFIGTEATDLPAPEGIAATWFYIKAQIGNTHPGACLPFSPVSVCPYSGAYDTGYGVYGKNTCGAPPVIFDKKSAYGITHVHNSGVGYIETFYNFFLTIPFQGSKPSVPDIELSKGPPYPLQDEHAEPGYYAARLDGVETEFELTVGTHSAAHRYRYQTECSPSGLVIDVTNAGLAQESERSRASGVDVSLRDGGSCTGKAMLHEVVWYFAILTGDPEVTTGLFRGTGISTENEIGMQPVNLVAESSLSLSKEACRASRAGVVISKPRGDNLTLYLGLSVADEASALEAARSAAATGFDALRADANRTWGDHLKRAEVEGAANKRTFYTGLYHSLIKPVESEADNYCWKGGPALYTDFATMWDQYKTQNPLVFTLFPERIVPIVRSVQKTAETLGNYTPGHVFGKDYYKFSGQSRGLCHVLLWDAYQRLEVSGALSSDDRTDWHKILDTMLDTVKKDRSSIRDGEKQSYSQLLDVSYASFCTKRLAEELGRGADAAVLSPYLGLWRDAFDPATGLMRDGEYYEAGPISYSFRLLHDMESRIALSGGPAKFAGQLDSFFGYGKEPVMQLGAPPWEPARSEAIKTGRFDGVNNEVTLETPYAYHYLGMPDKTAEVVSGVMEFHFSDKPGGLPGNDDSGGLSSWYSWNAIGLFPVPGQGIFFVGSPLFKHVVLMVGTKRFTIEVDKPSDEAIYPAAIEINGKDVRRTFLTYREVLNGGSLRIVLTGERGSFTPEELPPSDRTP